MSSAAEQIATLMTRVDRQRAELDALQKARQMESTSKIALEGRLAAIESRLTTADEQIADLNKDRKAVIYAVFAAVGGAILAAIGWTGKS